jgi:hypothetical protein
MSERLSDDELVAIASDWETGNSEECRTIRALLAHSSALSKEAGEAREALRPFAKCVEEIPGDESDEEWAKFRLLVSDYRRAATRRGRERVHDLPAGRAESLASRYVGVIIGSRRYQREWARKRMREDPTYRLNARIRKAVHGSLRGLKRGRPWCVLTGYSVADLKEHLETRFTEGMTWENYGKWHVDHIRPLRLSRHL